LADRLAGKTDAMGNLKAGFMRDATGKIISTGNDGRQDPIIPAMAKAIEEKDTEEYVNPLSLLTPRIAGSRYLGSEFAADGGRIGFFLGGNFQQSEKQKQRDIEISRKEAARSRDDDSPQQTTTKPSGGIPAADIFKEATRRGGFQLIDPKQRRRFAEVFDRKKIIESGAGVPKSGFGLLGGLTDEGQALEDFRKSAVNFKK
jgi:hypothetical protein